MKWIHIYTSSYEHGRSSSTKVEDSGSTRYHDADDMTSKTTEASHKQVEGDEDKESSHEWVAQIEATHAPEFGLPRFDPAVLLLISLKVTLEVAKKCNLDLIFPLRYCHSCLVLVCSLQEVHDCGRMSLSRHIGLCSLVTDAFSTPK